MFGVFKRITGRLFIDVVRVRLKGFLEFLENDHSEFSNDGILYSASVASSMNRYLPLTFLKNILNLIRYTYTACT